MARYYWMNTEAQYAPDMFTRWFENGVAASGGERKYGKLLGKLQRNDVILAYENMRGLVGLGKVREPWDGKGRTNGPIYRSAQVREYHVSVQWFADFRDHPMSPAAVRKYFREQPRSTLRIISRHAREAERFVAQHETKMGMGAADSQLSEGTPSTVLCTRYERNPLLRRKCIHHWGTTCCVCGFSFEDKYGAIGRGYIHVHHTKPISSLRGRHVVDPVRDMRPICANCHAMIHAGGAVLPIEDLIKTIANRNAERERRTAEYRTSAHGQARMPRGPRTAYNRQMAQRLQRHLPNVVRNAAR